MRVLGVSVLLLLTLGCATQRPKVVTVGDLARAPQTLAGRHVAVSGRAENVRYREPDGIGSGITFRLVDGTGAVPVVHEGTLTVPTGAFVQVRGHLDRDADGHARLIAERIWILPGASAP